MHVSLRPTLDAHWNTSSECGSIRRVRRHAHGTADWISALTTSIEMALAVHGGPNLRLLTNREPADDHPTEQGEGDR